MGRFSGPVPVSAPWQALRCRAAGEALTRIFSQNGCAAEGRPVTGPAGDAPALLLTVEGETRRQPVGPVKLLWQGQPTGNSGPPDWPRGIAPDAARFFLTARPLSAPAEVDLDLAARRDFGNPFYLTDYVRRRLFRLCAREEELPDYVENLENLENITFSDDERALALLTTRFPEILRQAAQMADPWPVNRYAVEQARALWRFFQIHGPAGRETRKTRLAAAGQLTLTRALETLGISHSRSGGVFQEDKPQTA